MKNLSFWAAAVALSTPLACRHPDFRGQYHDMRANMINGDWKTASAQLESSKEKVYGKADRVMFWLNMGTVLHYANEFDKSQQNLVEAEKTMDELFTKSITEEASKLIISESIQDYPGEDFEKVLLYLYTSLNNIKLNKINDALVEARRADELLKKMQVHAEKEGKNAVGTIYKQDAFMLWLVGLFYEMEGKSSMNDAFLAYKAAYKSYREDYAGHFGSGPPKFLGEDLVRTAKLMGFEQDAEQFKKETGASGETAEKLQAGGEVVLIHAMGEAPFKEEFFIDGKMPDGYVMRIALPKFVAIQGQVAYAEVKAGGVDARSELAEPISQIVLKNFEYRLPAIQARAIARAIVKYAATKTAQAGADKADKTGVAGALVGLAGNVASAASEAADCRSWTTLPSSVGVARMWLPAGHHQLEITFHNGSGAVIGSPQSIAVDVAAGEHKIVSVRSLL
jgi:hypothetical protein